MITHNGTYLGAATHHGMPIVAATMGGKMVIGYGLLSATLQAIVAAFGAEGTEVIAKTNDYLNRIATTDPQRALQISGFINEDPLLVCSLVETSKTRWLVGDGESWIMTGVNASLTTGIEVKFKLLSLDNNHSTICLIDKSSGNEAFGLAFWDKKWVYNYGNYNFQDTAKLDVLYHYKQLGGNIQMVASDGYSVSIQKTASKIIDAEIPFPNQNRNLQVSNFAAVLETPFFRIYDRETIIKDFVPFVSPTRNGMLDLVNMEFHPNQGTGSFTIAITDKV
jgi:hypothetical protein